MVEGVKYQKIKLLFTVPVYIFSCWNICILIEDIVLAVLFTDISFAAVSHTQIQPWVLSDKNSEDACRFR